MNLLSAFLTIALLIELDMTTLTTARPSRFHRRNRGSKGKRTWKDSAASALSTGSDLSPNADALPELGEKSSWLELEETPPSLLNAAAQSDLTLECVAVGSPPPRVYWLKNGKPVDHANSYDADAANQVFGWPIVSKRSGPDAFSVANVKAKLPLRCLRPEDQAEYTCVAESQGKQLVSTTLVAVDEPTGEIRSECSIQYTKKGKKVQAPFIMSYEYLHMDTIGNDAFLQCTAVGKPRPKVTWVDSDGNRILSGKKFRITGTGSLVIRNLSWKEMGEYTCQAENDYGSDSASTFLYPLLNDNSGS